MTTARKTTAPAESNQDTEAIQADPSICTLMDGTEVYVERLKTRQLFRLLKVLTTGAGEFLSTIQLSAEMNTEEFAGNLLAALVIAIPEAEDEAMEFIISMVSPVGIIEGKKLSDIETEINVDKYAHLQEILFNPEIEDTITIIERVIQVEAPHIQSLGKRLSLLLKTQQVATQAKQGGSSKKSS